MSKSLYPLLLDFVLFRPNRKLGQVSNRYSPERGASSSIAFVIVPSMSNMLPLSWLSWCISPLLDVLAEQRVGREAKSGNVSSSTMLGGGDVVGQ